jgi:hypothetical protein
MLLQREIEDVVQTYRCFSCRDRWAIVYLNSQGGVGSIEHTNESFKRKVMLTFGLTKVVGEVIWKKKNSLR